MKGFRGLINRILKTKKTKPAVTQDGKGQPLADNLAQNEQAIKEVLGDSEDVIIRRFKVGMGEANAFILFIEGMADKTFIADYIMKSLMFTESQAVFPHSAGTGLLELIKDCFLAAGEVKEVKDLDEVLSEVIFGDTAIFVDGSDRALVVSSKGFPSRGVEEPETETVVRGPREGFTEVLRTNTTLMRRILKTPGLRFEVVTVGRKTRTKVCLAYLKGVCRESIVCELRKRLERIDTDAILDSGYIEQFIEDAPNSLFATIGTTERPDVAAGKILEGRVALIVEGSPMVLTVPYLFIEGFQTSEDYTSRVYFMSLVRVLRFLAFFITVYLPGLYIALTTYHQEMVPTSLLISMASAREGVPFPALVEVLGMGVVFEFIREAGIRMPRPVGQAVSIVGALVIGEAAVLAGLVGAPVIIVTALTAITIFIIPSKLDAATVLRLGFTLAAGVAGFYGILLLTLVVFIHLVALRSFGIPYMSPLAPLLLHDLKDLFIRAPLWTLDTRPGNIGRDNPVRQAGGLKPGPGQKGRR